jgi:aspartyl-tRNA(Asn)/glutamyl-tRNA(Gln) amidotransferase subunit C
MPVTKEDVERTAGLARLRLTPEEMEIMLGELNVIFDYFEKLKAVDTTNVRPLHHVLDMSNVTQPDVPAPCLSREDALRNAPDRTDEYFRIPRVVK